MQMFTSDLKTSVVELLPLGSRAQAQRGLPAPLRTLPPPSPLQTNLRVGCLMVDRLEKGVQGSQNVKLYQWTNALFAYIRSNLWSSLKSQDDYWPMSRYLFTRGTLPKPPWWLWYWRGSTQPYNFFNIFQILKIIHLDISSTTKLVKIF